MRIETVTTLKWRAQELLAEIEKDKKPILIAEYGLPGAYLVDVESYESLHQRLAVLEGVTRGEMAVADSYSMPHEQAKPRLDRWLK